MRRSFATGCLAVGATMLVACTGNSSETGVNTADSTTTSPQATVSIAVSVPPAPVQTGTEQVRFDPCVSVGDDLVTRAGFAPATRERYAAESVSVPLTKIGCQFWRETLVDGEKYPTGLVSVTSSDLSLDDIRKNPGYSVFDSSPISGREAVLYRTPDNDGTCSASIASSDGTFTVGMNVQPGPVVVPSACDQIHEIAETFGEALGTN
ncbi:DUF3558 domain-containing protein [Nocardia mangyaensis]|uniref:DUF3558 domain-containing protein n=1 Tax=Nocardia mangyaensis TaxID=2213200 RepID=UPI0026763144|nr:DUF3558 domain-containing protein [Nocardia mangyaensis]MDO3650493.1 DUF3558 domain-containing protein [Nocardia mangyaensis]